MTIDTNQNIASLPEENFYFSGFQFLFYPLIFLFFFLLISVAIFWLYLSALHLDKFSILSVAGTALIISIFLFLSVFVIKKINPRLNSGSQLKISQNGIWIKDYGLFQWSNILRVEVVGTIGGGVPNAILVIITADGGDKPTRYLISQLNNFRRIIETINVINNKPLNTWLRDASFGLR